MNNSNNDYSYWVRFASSAAIVAAFSMILVKGYAWLNTDSASVLASLTDSVFDVAASIVNFFAVRYALTPADDDHRFGHGKAESLAGLFQSAFITGSALLLIFHSVGRISHPQNIDNISLGLAAIYFSIFITLLLVVIQTFALKKTGSIAIKADSLHYKGDLLMNVGVLFALYLTQFGYSFLDSWIAIGIALYLFYGAYEVGSESVQSLMDKELSNDDQQTIMSIAQNIPLVKGIHGVRTRQSGGTVFIQLHLELEDDMSLLDAHDVSEKVEAALENAYPFSDILIHLDPVSIVRK
ncbi:cation diffusion facilitator family transporter [Psychrosphaera aquimarina]|uniref:Cation diffusion facilitator family transporter n=1 Tax=Psychrosphaera aquimarina TaxID=2044854 RepID=A0ABU3R357_9GAMM|nr:cation diffusion facilitator family transporter [Psychrosphaera aquimarina]MDU0114112.1 cation diffusion facilitator family transporter [Psychrosphaera aquimarina]